MATIKSAWPSLKPETRLWLTSNIGKPVPTEVASEIIQALGFSASEAWFDHARRTGIVLASDEIAWIEEAGRREPSRMSRTHQATLPLSA